MSSALPPLSLIFLAISVLRSSSGARVVPYSQLDLHRFSVSLPSFRKPFTHSFSQARWIDGEACFQLAFGDGQGVVKFAGAGEIAHTESVEPFERDGFSFVANHSFGRQFLRVHCG